MGFTSTDFNWCCCSNQHCKLEAQHWKLGIKSGQNNTPNFRAFSKTNNILLHTMCVPTCFYSSEPKPQNLLENDNFASEYHPHLTTQNPNYGNHNHMQNITNVCIFLHMIVISIYYIIQFRHRSNIIIICIFLHIWFSCQFTAWYFKSNFDIEYN